MRVALFANDSFGSYVFDTVCSGPAEIVCVVGETQTLRGRARRKLRKLARRPSTIFRILKPRRSPGVTSSFSRRSIHNVRPLTELCKLNDIPFFEDVELATGRFARLLESLRIDAILVATFGSIIDSRVIAIPNRGIVNFHFSLLPKYRGMTPEICCLLDGAETTGITAHYIDDGIDTGPIIAQRTVKIEVGDDFLSLQRKLYPQGRKLVADVLRLLNKCQVSATPQIHSDATVCRLPAGFPRIRPRDMNGDEAQRILKACKGSRYTPFVDMDGSKRIYIIDADVVGESASVEEGSMYLQCRDGVGIAARHYQVVDR